MSLNIFVQIRHRAFHFLGGYPILKIYADIDQNKFGPHVHREHFVDMLHARKLFGNIPNVLHDLRVGALSNQQPFGFIGQPYRRSTQNQPDNKCGNTI